MYTVLGLGPSWHSLSVATKLLFLCSLWTTVVSRAELLVLPGMHQGVCGWLGNHPSYHHIIPHRLDVPEHFHPSLPTRLKVSESALPLVKIPTSCLQWDWGSVEFSPFTQRQTKSLARLRQSWREARCLGNIVGRPKHNQWQHYMSSFFRHILLFVCWVT